MTEMKALLRFPGARKIALTRCPIPAMRPHAVLIRTTFTVISPGTEFEQARQATASLFRKAWQRPDLVALTLNSLQKDGPRKTLGRVHNRLGHPMPMGYCGAGIVTALGEGVQQFAVGQRVAIAGMGQANHAEWNLVGENLACAIPDRASDHKAAFATLYALALHALKQGETGIGDHVAVIGAGLVGQILCEVAHCAGAQIDVIEPVAIRRKRAETRGAQKGFARTGEAPGNIYDAVYICAPAKGAHDLIDEAARMCRDRAIIVCVGDVTPHARRKGLYEREITLRQVRSYGPGRYDPAYEEDGQDYPVGHVRWTVQRYMKAALALMADGRLDPTPLITDEIPLEQIEHHFRAGPDSNQLATLVRYAPEQQTSPQPTATSNATVATEPLGPRSGKEGPGETPLDGMAENRTGTDRTVKVALIGTGNYPGGTLLPILMKNPDIRIVACASRTGRSAMAIARKTGTARAFSDIGEMLDHPEVNSVIIATHHDSHAELAAQAMAAKKHVWLEKPVAIGTEGLELLRKGAPDSDKVFMVGHNRRYAPMTRALLRALPKGPKQIHYRVRFTPLPGGHWLARPNQGGRAIGEISHFIDLVKCLAGHEITELTCHWRDNAHGDSIWQMQFADGSIGEISYLCNQRRMAKEVLEISAPGFDACLLDWRKLRVNGRTVARHWLGADKGHAAAIRCFVDATRTGQAGLPVPSLQEEIDLMTRILAAARSPGHRINS